MTLLVIAAALLMKLYIAPMGPWGKDVGGVAAGLAMLLTGVRLERRERYRVFGRGLMGGGWALLFFMSFALHHVAATRVISSELADLVLMLATAAMTAHSLRYRSQTVTGLAMLLAFVTVSISQQTSFSVTAGAILTVSVIVMSHRMRWRWLEMGGMAAAYANECIWLHRVGGVDVHALGRAQIVLSASLLLFYWLSYKLSYIASPVGDEFDHLQSGVFSFLNSALALLLWRQQQLNATDDALFAMCLAAAAMETAAAFAVWRRRPRQRMLSPTLATLLLLFAAPLHWERIPLIVVWALAAEALLALGALLADRGFWRLACIAGAASTAAAVVGASMDAGQAWKLYPLAAVFALSHALWRLFRPRLCGNTMELCLPLFVGYASILAVVAAATGQGPGWHGAAMVVPAVAAVVGGWACRDECIRAAGDFLALLGGVVALFDGAQAPYAAWGAPAYAPAMLAPAILLLGLSWAPEARDERLRSLHLRLLHFIMGILLIAVYLWVQPNGWLTAPLLSALGVLVFELGARAVADAHEGGRFAADRLADARPDL